MSATPTSSPFSTTSPVFVDFFLLQDLATNDRTAVSFFLPFDDFQIPAYPNDVDMYLEYRRRAIEFVQARCQRIADLGL